MAQPTFERGFDFDEDDDWGKMDEIPALPEDVVEKPNPLMESSTHYLFEVPESEPPSNITGFGGGSGSGQSSSVSDSFLPSQTMTPIQTLSLAQGLKLFSGVMLIFCLVSVILKQYGMALGIGAHAIGLYAFWKVHRLAIFIFMILSILDLGAMFAFAYIEEFYNNTPLLALQFLVLLVKFFGLYNAYSLWTQLTQDAGGLSPGVALDV